MLRRVLVLSILTLAAFAKQLENVRVKRQGKSVWYANDPYNNPFYFGRPGYGKIIAPYKTWDNERHILSRPIGQQLELAQEWPPIYPYSNLRMPDYYRTNDYYRGIYNGGLLSDTVQFVRLPGFIYGGPYEEYFDKISNVIDHKNPEPTDPPFVAPVVNSNFNLQTNTLSGQITQGSLNLPDGANRPQPRPPPNDGPLVIRTGQSADSG